MNDLKNGEYYSQGSVIHKSPVVTKNPAGGSTVSIGFPVCTISDYIDDSGITFIIDVLNNYENPHKGCFFRHCNPHDGEVK